MKNKILLLFLLLVSCSPKNPGWLTLVNSHVETIKISVDGRSFTIRPSNHITKQVSEGLHELRIDNGAPVPAAVLREKTTVFDSTGLSCYVAVDFSQRFRGGNPQIIERFEHQQIFTTSDKMTAILGSPLPKSIRPDERALRIHQVDCELIGNEAGLIEELSSSR